MCLLSLVWSYCLSLGAFTSSYSLVPPTVAAALVPGLSFLSALLFLMGFVADATEQRVLIQAQQHLQLLILRATSAAVADSAAASRGAALS